MPARPPCPHLAAIIAAVEAAEPGLLDRLGIGRRRRRNSAPHGMCSLEQGGPSPDGAYLELTLHHREADREVRVTLVAYQPLSAGGQIVDLGSTVRTYRTDANKVTIDVATAVRGWLTAHVVDAMGSRDT